MLVSEHIGGNDEHREPQMRQERIQKTTRRRSRLTEHGPLIVAVDTADTSAAQDVLELIDHLLEVA